MGKDDDGFLDPEDCLMIFGGSKNDHPSHVAQPSLVIDPIICKKHLTKVLMDGGNDLNILYIDTLNTMRILWSKLCPPCHTKFMAIPNYTYLKLKMSGPNNVITVGSTFLHTYTCGCEHFKLATAIINSAELSELRNSSTPAVPYFNEPNSSSTFHPTEETKAVGIKSTDSIKTVRIGTKLLAK
ncbi:uncharacterized protein [Miscanthus floridulus]|uniref:uncharacterized protein n=1 Tax=Miscanthus floridulus TaxID=154761 RepID=UPI0034592B46